MNIIVLEGPECAGKSHLAGLLMAHYAPDVKVLKQGPPPVTDHRLIMAHYLKPLQDFFIDDSVTYVMDRWHVGEMIYGPRLRNRTLLTEQQGDYIDMVLQSFGADFFHVTASLKTLEERYDQRGDDLIRKSQIFGLTVDYDGWMGRRPHWKTVSSVDFIPPPLKLSSPRAGQYIGPRRPKVLLLGDQRNDHRMIFPFVPERATSGHWLMGAMRFAEVNHMDVGIINANEIGVFDLYTHWQILGAPPVISLGRHAEKAWKIARAYSPQSEWDEKSFYLNHPQYERRFHHTAMERYGQMIKDVMNDGV